MTQAILEWAQSADRGYILAIGLMPVLIFMINSLHSRPEDKRAERLMIDCVTTNQCFETYDIEHEKSEEDKITVRYERHSRGIFFPADIIASTPTLGTPHLPPRLKVGDQVFLWLMKKNLLQLELEFDVMQYSKQQPSQRAEPPPRHADKNLPRNNHRRHHRIIYHAGPTEADEMIELDRRDVHFGPRRAPRLQESERRRDIADLSDEVSKILARFFPDVMLCSPCEGRGRFKSPYCRLDTRARQQLKAEHFKNHNLAIIWRRCLLLDGNMSHWDSAFDHLFPLEGDHDDRKGRQNYSSCGYYTRWLAVMDSQELAGKIQIRNKVKVSAFFESFRSCHCSYESTMTDNKTTRQRLMS
jgi:hypothetical protein